MSDYWSTCESCQLYKTCSKPQYPLYGSRDARVLIISEAPHSFDESKGVPLSSDSGQLLKDVLSAVEFDMSDIAITYAVRCRPPGNIPPTKEQCEACAINSYLDMLSMPNLKIVVPLGSVALHTYTKKTGILKAHGSSVFVDGIKYFPLMHPAAVIRDPTKHDRFVHGVFTLKRIYDADKLDRHGSVEYILVDTVAKFDDMYEKLVSSGKDICVDIETSGLQPFVHSAKVVGIGLGINPKHAYFVPVDHSSNTFIGEEQRYVINKLKELLSDISKHKFGHNVKFDSEYMEVCWNFETAGFTYDTMLGEYLLDENKRVYKLKPMALEYTDMGDYEAELDNYLQSMGLTKADMYRVPLDLLMRYCCCDVDATSRIRELQEPKLRADAQLSWVMDNLLMPGSELSKDIEKAGIGIDDVYLAELEASIPKEMADLEGKMRAFPEVALLEREILQERFTKNKRAQREPLNFGSSVQLGKLLFEKLKLPVIAVTDKKKPSTNKRVIEALSKMHEFPKTLMQWKQLSSAYTKYVSKIRVDWLQELDGRVHGSYMLHGTRTGRYASAAPNMQNIPRDKKIKNIFIPRPGYVYVHFDYSQIELRVLAIVSKDQMMMTAFRQDDDIHTATAAIVAGVDVKELQALIDAGDPIAKDKRRIAKTINFGLLYGMGAYKLSGMLGLSEDEGQAFIDRYFSKLPGVKRFIDHTHRLVKDQLFVTSMFGRKRRLPYARSRDMKLASRAERQSVNSIIQSTAADMTLYSMITMNKYLKTAGLHSRIVMTVHDSIVVECPVAETLEVKEALQCIMEDLPFTWIDVPIKAECEMGNKLGDLNMTADNVFSMVAEEAEDDDVREQYMNEEDKEKATYVVNGT